MYEKFKEITKYIKEYNADFGILFILSLIIGTIGGVFGTAFSKSIALVTNLRTDNGWLVYLLPIGGILSVGLSKLLRVESLGTNQVFESTRSDKKVSFWLAPVVFVCSVLTHLFGGSAGREGAALQLGGGTATLFCNIFKLDEKKKRILIRCGMAAFFSAIFGTPLAASVFVLEVVTVGSIYIPAVFPVFVSGITAYFTAHFLGAHAEHFTIGTTPYSSPLNVLKILLIAVMAAIVSVIFCKGLHFAEHIFKKYLKNSFLRAFVGGAIIVLLTVIVGTRDYNGGGIEVIERIFESGEVKYEAFLLKIVFTCITVAAGFRGGEIVPTLFIGATLGGVLGSLIGLDAAMGAAVGMSALFCGVTNAPLSSILLSAEMFGGESLLYCAISVIMVFALSGKCSLYSSQQFAEQ